MTKFELLIAPASASPAGAKKNFQSIIWLFKVILLVYYERIKPKESLLLFWHLKGSKIFLHTYTLPIFQKEACHRAKCVYIRGWIWENTIINMMLLLLLLCVFSSSGLASSSFASSDFEPVAQMIQEIKKRSDKNFCTIFHHDLNTDEVKGLVRFFLVH